MINGLKIICLVAIFSFCKAENVFAQKNIFWLSLGVGSSNIAGLSAGEGLYYQPKPKGIYYGIRNYNSAELWGIRTSNEISPIIGYGISGKYAFIGLGGGLGYIWGYKRGLFLGDGWFGPDYEAKHYSTIGIPLEMQFRIQPVKYVGIGVSAFANINDQLSNSGLFLSLTLGKLR